MKGTKQDLLNALKPLGEYKILGSQIKFNCKQCELDGNPIDKFNLEIQFTQDKKRWHCWCCNDSGSLYSLIQKYGYTEYLPLFKTIKDSITTPTLLEIKPFELPSHLMSANKHLPAKEYLLTRKVNWQLIQKLNIKYCYEGPYKNNLIFPSYVNNKLVGYVSHSLSTKQYKTHKTQDFTCLWETFIDKNSKIILTEGAYDACVLPNAIPLLGLGISDKLVEWLADCDVLIMLDSVVNQKVKKEIYKKLISVTDKVEFFNLPSEYSDANDIAIKANNKLVSLLEIFY